MSIKLDGIMNQNFNQTDMKKSFQIYNEASEAVIVTALYDFDIDDIKQLPFDELAYLDAVVFGDCTDTERCEKCTGTCSTCDDIEMIEQVKELLKAEILASL